MRVRLKPCVPCVKRVTSMSFFLNFPPPSFPSNQTSVFPFSSRHMAGPFTLQDGTISSIYPRSSVSRSLPCILFPSMPKRCNVGLFANIRTAWLCPFLRSAVRLYTHFHTGAYPHLRSGCLPGVPGSAENASPCICSKGSRYKS